MFKNAKRGEAQKFIRNLPDTDRCIIWPFYIYASGYGYIKYLGLDQPAHRVSLILANNGVDRRGLDASHACHIRSCVNPNHLSWKTRTENLNDRAYNGTVNRGEVNGNAKLSRADVAAIHADKRVQHVIAAEYGVSQSAISFIKCGQRWVA